MKTIWIGLLSVFLGVSQPDAAADSTPDQQAVIVHFKYGSRDLKPLFALEDKLTSAIKGAGAGDFDGDEVAPDGHDGYLYMYSDDADRLFAVITPILKAAPFMKGARIAKRYGPPGKLTREEVFDFK